MRESKVSRTIHPDPCPNLVVECGPENKGVGSWVAQDKHRLLYEYLDGSRLAWRKWPRRVFIDPFCGPGRIQVAGEETTRDGGAVLAWRSLEKTAPFTHMLVGDLDGQRAEACAARLKALGAPAKAFTGPAERTVSAMVADVPPRALCMAYVDPYNLEHLSFSILEALASLRKVDLAINFCTMDLQRNVELEFDPSRTRFDAVAPGWRGQPSVVASSKQNVKLAFFKFWCELVRGLDFEDSREMPPVHNDNGHMIYRMVFFARNGFPKRIWGDVARGPNREFSFDE